jgi:hypothetical protein
MPRCCGPLAAGKAHSGQHFEEYWVFGVFMLVVAWLQLLWAIVAVANYCLAIVSLATAVIHFAVC